MSKKITMLTAWDYPTGKILEEVGIDYILVGDSLAGILGLPSTKEVTMKDMISHTKAVARAVSKTPIIGDMPINSYNSISDALKNANLLLSAGATMIKIEGYKEDIVKALIENNIPVVGHLGLLPQTAEKNKVTGRDPQEAEKILSDAIALDTLGIQLLILECIPVTLAKKITEKIKTPTIGIGAGKYTSGQVLVLADVLGLSEKKLKMAKQYANVLEIMKQAAREFKEDVESEAFPKEENSFV